MDLNGNYIFRNGSFYLLYFKLLWIEVNALTWNCPRKSNYSSGNEFIKLTEDHATTLTVVVSISNNSWKGGVVKADELDVLSDLPLLTRNLMNTLSDKVGWKWRFTIINIRNGKTLSFCSLQLQMLLNHWKNYFVPYISRMNLEIAGSWYFENSFETLRSNGNCFGLGKSLWSLVFN